MNDKKYPVKAVWKNNDYDQEVLIVDCYGDHCGIIYYRAESGTGIPEHQLEFIQENLLQKFMGLFKK